MKRTSKMNWRGDIGIAEGRGWPDKGRGQRDPVIARNVSSHTHRFGVPPHRYFLPTVIEFTNPNQDTRNMQKAMGDGFMTI